MKPFFAIAIVTSILGFVTAANGQGQEKPAESKSETTTKKQIELPESESTAVFTMKFAGGYRGALPDTPREPHLQIFADGRVVTPSEAPGGTPSEIKLTPKQLQDFLEQVVNKNRFYDLGTEKIKEDIEAAAPIARIADAPTLEVLMDLPRGAHAVSVYTPKSVAKQLPKVKSIQQIAKIKELGDQLFLVTRAGGYEKVERALSKVNKQLKERGLDLMTLNELYTCRTKDDILTINFNRKYYKENGRWRDWINANFIIDGDNEEVVIKTNIEKDKGKDKAKDVDKGTKKDKEKSKPAKKDASPSDT